MGKEHTDELILPARELHEKLFAQITGGKQRAFFLRLQIKLHQFGMRAEAAINFIFKLRARPHQIIFFVQPAVIFEHAGRSIPAIQARVRIAAAIQKLIERGEAKPQRVKMPELRAGVGMTIIGNCKRNFFQKIRIEKISVRLHLVAARSNEMNHAITGMTKRPQRAARRLGRKLRRGFNDTRLLLIVARTEIQQVCTFGAIRAHDKLGITLVAEIDVAHEMGEELGGSCQCFKIHIFLIRFNLQPPQIRRFGEKAAAGFSKTVVVRQNIFFIKRAVAEMQHRPGNVGEGREKISE
ncbi:MAG: hypothetical protein ALAOOOJD_01538 [bacterium]|nr:hypothetical protein [bacterium]